MALPKQDHWQARAKVLGWDHSKGNQPCFVCFSQNLVQSVCISSCGNFAVVGYTSGRCDMFNLQSGAHRRTFQGHSKTVTGLAIDTLNSKLVSSSLDGTVIVWDFAQARILHIHEIGSAVTQLSFLRDVSSLFPLHILKKNFFYFFFVRVISLPLSRMT